MGDKGPVCHRMGFAQGWFSCTYTERSKAAKGACCELAVLGESRGKGGSLRPYNPISPPCPPAPLYVPVPAGLAVLPP